MGGLKEYIRFIRVGSLDNPNLMPPDVHIFTLTKQEWVVLSPTKQAVEEFYDVDTTWPSDSLKRLDKLDTKAGIKKTWRQQRSAAK